MPITIQDIKEHQEHFGITALSTMTIKEYRQALNRGAFLWIDHHDYVRSTFSGEIIATDYEQVELLIEYLQKCKNIMLKSFNT